MISYIIKKEIHVLNINYYELYLHRLKLFAINARKLFLIIFLFSLIPAPFFIKIKTTNTGQPHANKTKIPKHKTPQTLTPF